MENSKVTNANGGYEGSYKMKMTTDSDKVIFLLMGTNDSKVIVDWGDGSEEISFLIHHDEWSKFSHEYPNKKRRTITVYGDSITAFDCSENKLTGLDVSKNAKLTILFCHRNQLTSLDVSKNSALTSLVCYVNQFTSLDVSKNSRLTELLCGENELTGLDVSKNSELMSLKCGINRLTSLDVSKNSALAKLWCGFNHLTSLDVSKNNALIELDCDYNLLTSLDVSKNTALTELNCAGNKITSLDVSKNTALTELVFSDKKEENNKSRVIVENGEIKTIFSEEIQNNGGWMTIEEARRLTHEEIKIRSELMKQKGNVVTEGFVSANLGDLERAINIDKINRTVEFYDSYKNGVVAGSDNNIIQPVYSKTEEGYPVISIFKRSKYENEAHDTDENPLIYALKEYNGWKLKNGKKDISNFLCRFVCIAHGIQEGFDTIIMIPSQNELNNRFLHYLTRIIPKQCVLKRQFVYLYPEEVSELINYKAIQTDFPNEEEYQTVVEQLEHAIAEQDSNKWFTFRLVPTKLRKYIGQVICQQEPIIDLSIHINDKDILILDDTIAEGTTISLMCRCILEMYTPKSVSVITLFSARS